MSMSPLQYLSLFIMSHVITKASLIHKSTSAIRVHTDNGEIVIVGEEVFVYNLTESQTCDHIK